MVKALKLDLKRQVSKVVLRSEVTLAIQYQTSAMIWSAGQRQLRDRLDFRFRGTCEQQIIHGVGWLDRLIQGLQKRVHAAGSSRIWNQIANVPIRDFRRF